MLKKSSISFSFIFELLIWLLYVAFYKYSYYMEQSNLPLVRSNFPYLEICLYSICSTIYLIPYYRWAVPRLLELKMHWWLLLLTVVYFLFLSTYNNIAVAWVFSKFTEGSTVHPFFINLTERRFLDFNTVLTDIIAFLGIAFSRFSLQNEMKRHQLETDHLHLQLNMLKTQLQPHFLFNTLNSLYGMSLTGSKDTSRFILLLSQMMQYILYDCDQDLVELKDELVFLEGYFEIEQKKFPDAVINLKIANDIPSLKIPPLLFLPLVENSFKHGKHKLENNAGVQAELLLIKDKLIFNIENDMLPAVPVLSKNKRGGIGLTNIKKRLELYYPEKNVLTITEINNKYIVSLSIDL